MDKKESCIYFLPFVAIHWYTSHTLGTIKHIPIWKRDDYTHPAMMKCHRRHGEALSIQEIVSISWLGLSSGPWEEFFYSLHFICTSCACQNVLFHYSLQSLLKWVVGTISSFDDCTVFSENFFSHETLAVQRFWVSKHQWLFKVQAYGFFSNAIPSVTW
jgi:hypothetical protein